jgi:hypothetical protein
MENRRLENAPKHWKQVMLQITSLSSCTNTSRKVMVYQSMMVIVIVSHLQRKLKIRNKGIMVMVFPNLFFIIKSIIM